MSITPSKAHEHDNLVAHSPFVGYGAAGAASVGRRCLYCGSIHPEELAVALRAGDATLSMADQKYGWPHKWYINSSGPLGWAKFYTLHLKDASMEDWKTIEKAMGLSFHFAGYQVAWSRYTP